MTHQKENEMSKTKETISRQTEPQDVLELGVASVETRGSGAGVEPTGIGRLSENGISEE